MSIMDFLKNWAKINHKPIIFLYTSIDFLRLLIFREDVCLTRIRSQGMFCQRSQLLNFFQAQMKVQEIILNLL